MQASAVQLTDDGKFPNNSLPALIYRAIVSTTGDAAAASFEHLFESYGWTDAWRNGIYDYHHYHSTAHEVLGIAQGDVKVQLGGPNGRVVELAAGDVVVIPAGVSHKNVGSSDDLLVVGAYPAHTSPDMCYGKPDERPAADERIAQVPLPPQDPVEGQDGRLAHEWGCGRSSSDSRGTRSLGEELLGTYLNDHLGGSMAGIETVEHCIATADGGAMQVELERLRDEIEEDRDVLTELIGRFEFRQNVLKKTAGWISEKAARLKVGSGSSEPHRVAFRMMEQLESLALGITGKRSLWKLLMEVLPDDPRLSEVDLNDLLQRAENQFERVDRMRLQTAREAFRGDRMA